MRTLTCSECGRTFAESASFSRHNKTVHKGKATAFASPPPTTSPTATRQLVFGRHWVTDAPDGGFTCDCPEYRAKNVCAHIAEVVKEGNDHINFDIGVEGVRFPLFVTPPVEVQVMLIRSAVDEIDEMCQAVIVTEGWMNTPISITKLGFVFPGVKRRILRSMTVAWLTSMADSIPEVDYECISQLHVGEKVLSAYVEGFVGPRATPENRKLFLADLWCLMRYGKCSTCIEKEKAAGML